MVKQELIQEFELQLDQKSQELETKLTELKAEYNTQKYINELLVLARKDINSLAEYLTVVSDNEKLLCLSIIRNFIPTEEEINHLFQEAKNLYNMKKRNFDTKWVDRTDEIRELAQIQKDILERYSLMTKVGGKLVYSTCSILPMENQNQVKDFLESHPNFKLEDEKFILPSQGGDGFYMARMVRLDAKENLDNDESQENEINENEIIENNSDSLE